MDDEVLYVCVVYGFLGGVFLGIICFFVIGEDFNNIEIFKVLEGDVI